MSAMIAAGVFVGAGGVDAYKVAAKDLALQHQTRVLAAGGVLPSLNNLQSFIYDLLKTIGSRDTANILLTTDPHLTGYKVGATATQTNTVFSLNQNTDLIQATSATQPLLLPYSGERYYWTNGASGNNISTNNVNSNTNNQADFELFVKIKCITGGGSQTIVGKWRTSDNKRQWYLSTDGTNIYYSISTDGTGSAVTVLSYASVIAVNELAELKLQKVGNDYKLYKKTSGNYNQVGTTQTTANLPFNSIAPITIAGVSSTINLFKGEIHSINLYSNTNTLVHSFDLTTYSFSAPNSFINSISETFTINRSATGYQSQIVIKNSIMTDGVDDVLSSSYTLPVNRTDYYKVTDSQITTSIQQLGKVDSTFKQHYGGCLFSFAGIHDLAKQTRVKTVLQNYTGFFFDVAGGGLILLDDTILTNDTILY